MILLIIITSIVAGVIFNSFLLGILAFVGMLILLLFYNKFESEKKQYTITFKEDNHEKFIFDLEYFLSSCGDNIIVFDFETNGLDPHKCSVLSCSAIKYKLINKTSLQEDGRFNRFYFPKEPFHKNATDINGLTRKRITELRASAEYERFFYDDCEFEKFCSGVSSFIAHNIEFDLQFSRFMIFKNLFCTMKSNTNLVKAKWMENKGQWKWPTLSETAKYYSINPVSNLLHNSMYDVEMTTLIFKEMLKRIEIKSAVNFELK